ncbi:MAG: hypothetical protein ACYDA3_07175 [Gaiellaceae bacterium]
MGRVNRLSMNADELESALVSRLPALAQVEDDGERSRKSDAISHFLAYVSLLRAAAPDEGAPRADDERESVARAFAFQLEFEDGRWDVEEKQLLSAPRPGETFSFRDGRRWRVYTSKIVLARPAHKRAREVFVCAPFA